MVLKNQNAQTGSEGKQFGSCAQFGPHLGFWSIVGQFGPFFFPSGTLIFPFGLPEQQHKGQLFSVGFPSSCGKLSVVFPFSFGRKENCFRSGSCLLVREEKVGNPTRAISSPKP